MSRSASPPQDFGALAAQYWQAFTEFGKQAGDAAKAVPGWSEALGQWERMARQASASASPPPGFPGMAGMGIPGMGIPGMAGFGRSGGGEVDAALERFSQQAGQWLGMLQGLAAQFAGKDPDASDVVRAWRSLLEGSGLAPFNQLMQGLPGGFPGVGDPGAMFGQMRAEAEALLGLPAFGFAREHQERLQRLAQAQMAVQPAVAAYQAQIHRANQRAFEQFELKLAERSEPGRQIDSVRGLFDLWIDAAEDAWSEVALSPEYQAAFVGMTNALMGLRAAQQAELAQALRAAGLPSREDVAAGDRRVVALENEVRQLRRRLAALEGGAPTAATSRPPRASGPAAARAEAPRSEARTAAKPAHPAASTRKPDAPPEAPPRAKRAGKAAAPRRAKAAGARRGAFSVASPAAVAAPKRAGKAAAAGAKTRAKPAKQGKAADRGKTAKRGKGG